MEQNPQHLKEKQREKEKELISSGALTKRTIKFSTQN
jgi:hypothetical protein